MRNEANKLMEFLEFTSEVSHPSNPVSCLDTQLWYGKPQVQSPWFEHSRPGEVPPGTIQGEGRILYKFFKKEVSNPLTILQRSAMPESIKVATFTN